jgi:tetratricopeptide (TPR) repeat protein
MAGISVFSFLCSLFSAWLPAASRFSHSGLKSEISKEAINYNASGLAFAQQGQYQQAIEAYKKAIMKEPAYADAYVNCSKAYYAIGNYDMARYYNLKSKEILESKATMIHESEVEQDEKK